MKSIRIKEYKKQLEKERRSVKAQLRKLPEGGFTIYRSGNCFKWIGISPDECTASGTKKRYYINRSKRKEAERLAYRKYLEELMDDLNHEIEALNRYCRHTREHPWKAEKLLMKDDGYYELIADRLGIVYEECNGWDQDYEQLDYRPEEKADKSLAGMMHRSKSEALIASRLYEYGIKFRYESKFVTVNGKLYWPDFVIMHPKTGELYIWEHLGIMDNPKYVSRNMDKIAEYGKSGYIVNRNLIITMEDGNEHLSIEEVDEIIEKYFL